MSGNEDESDPPDPTEEPEYSDEPDQTHPKTRNGDDDRDDDAEDRAADDDDATEARSEVADMSQQVGLEESAEAAATESESLDESGDSGDPDTAESEGQNSDSTTAESSDTLGGESESESEDGAGPATETAGASGAGAGGVGTGPSTASGETSGSTDGEGDSDAGGNTSEGSFTFSPEDAEDWGKLGSYGFPSGITASNMRVAELEDWDGESNEGLAFVTFYDGDSVPGDVNGGEHIRGEKTDLGNRQMVTYTFVDAAGGNVPTHVGHPTEDGYVAAEGVNGENIGTAPPEYTDRADQDELVQECSYQLLAGNNDAHYDNILVQPDGTFVVHDIDHSAGDMTSGFTGNKSWYDNALDRTLSEMWRSASEVYSGSEAEFKQEVLDQAQQDAQQLRDDPEVVAALNEAEQYDPELADNIRSNLDNAANGNLEVP